MGTRRVRGYSRTCRPTTHRPIRTKGSPLCGLLGGEVGAPTCTRTIRTRRSHTFPPVSPSQDSWVHRTPLPASHVTAVTFKVRSFKDPKAVTSWQASGNPEGTLVQGLYPGSGSLPTALLARTQDKVPFLAHARSQTCAQGAEGSSLKAYATPFSVFGYSPGSGNETFWVL